MVSETHWLLWHWSAGFCDNPFARNRSSGAENARQLRRKLSGKSGSHGQPERHRLGRQGGNGLAQGQLSLLLKQQQEESRPAVQSDASHGSRRKQHSLLSMQLKGLGCGQLMISQNAYTLPDNLHAHPAILSWGDEPSGHSDGS